MQYNNCPKVYRQSVGAKAQSSLGSLTIENHAKMMLNVSRGREPRSIKCVADFKQDIHQHTIKQFDVQEELSPERMSD